MVMAMAKVMATRLVKVVELRLVRKALTQTGDKDRTVPSRRKAEGSSLAVKNVCTRGFC